MDLRAPGQKVFVTGAAGFIGSNLVDRLLSLGISVVGYDDLSTGQEDFLQAALKNPGFSLVRGDILDLVMLKKSMAGCQLVIHLAANADIRRGLEDPHRDLEQNTLGTFNVLEAARATQVPNFAFSSTGSVYGEPEVFPTPENAPFPVQTSLYAASKLAGEGLIQAYATGYGIKAFVFRFVSILGERYTHGHVFDFYKKLRSDPTRLEVLGDGKQRKSYLYVQDCLDAMLLAFEKAENNVNIFNLGSDETCEVADSIAWICGHLGLKPQLAYSGGKRGWIGDSPMIHLDCSRIRALGWAPKLTIRQAVLRTVDFLKERPGLLDKR
ncbi:MAG: NAD-dependent epimerase/dehydratase family protein [candidate division FCPU426 bacterium]